MVDFFKKKLRFLLMSGLALLPAFVQAAAPITEEEAYAIGVEAYIYAYPMVLMELTRRVGTNVVAPHDLRAPMGRFAHMQTYPDATFRDVVRPNADTLYSTMWFDVGSEPLVVTLPDTGNRYHVIPLYDMWTDVFATLGTRTTGNGGGSFAIVSSKWKGSLPKGMRPIVSPTEVGWIVGRVQTNGTADYDNVHRLQAGLKATPLSAWGKPQNAAVGRIDPSIDMTTPPPEQVKRLEPSAFFALFAEVLKRNPPHAADYHVLLRMERIGMVAGRSFDLAKADPAVQRALVRAAPDAHKRMIEVGRTLRQQRNGWYLPSRMIGIYGNDYLLRAFIAYAGLGALPPEDAIYPSANVGPNGKPLEGTTRQVLHFDKEQLPPDDAFWSLTMYGADQYFIANPINRFAIGDRDKLAFNPDGSLDLYIQHESPGKDKEQNWLPAPAGRYSINLRLYLPHAQATDGRWVPPPLTQVP